MAVEFTKKAREGEREFLEDKRWERLIELQAWAAEQKKDPRLKELTDLQSAFIEQATEFYGIDGEHTVVVAAGEIDLKPAPETRTVVNLKRIHEILGDESFYAVATVPLKTVDDYLTLPQREEVTVKGRGKRSVKASRRRD